MLDLGYPCSMPQDPYTRVPNLVYDIIGPLLSSAERDCLFYIVRRTWGFPDANGAPKARDTIALDQFENGVTSGNTLLDLGTQLSRNTIKKALKGLEDKELVEIRYACLHCMWEQSRGQEPPEIKGKSGRTCPRCGASLSRAWALAEFTPRKVKALLNEHDKKGRVYVWDPDERRFHFSNLEEEKAQKLSEKDIEAEIDRLRDLVWYPDLVEQAIEMASGATRSGKKITLNRQLNNFWKPVWDLQEKYPSPMVVKYALEQTLAAGVPGQPSSYRWFRYMEVVAKNAAHQNERREGGSDVSDEVKQAETTVRDLLSRAASLNGMDQSEGARALLSDILAMAPSLVSLFDGDEDLCEKSLREAYKQGSSDFRGIQPDQYGLDFYPEWSWED